MGIFFRVDFADKYLDYWPESDDEKPSRLTVILLLYLMWYTPLAILFYAALCGSPRSIVLAVIVIPLWLIGGGYWFYRKFTQY